MSYSLWPHDRQHNTIPRPSLSPWVCSNSCPLGQWCHPTFSISVTLFASCPQSFPALGSFLRSQLFASGGQIIGAPMSSRHQANYFKLVSRANITDSQSHKIASRTDARLGCLNPAGSMLWQITKITSSCVHAPLQCDFAAFPIKRWHFFPLPLNIG